MTGNNTESPTFSFDTSGKLFKLVGEIKTRTPENPQLYQGNPEIVPDIMKRIFPDVNFSQLETNQIYPLLKNANHRLAKIDLSTFHDSTTTTTVIETLSMAYRTSHPLAVGRTKKEMIDVLVQTKKHLSKKELSIIDIGYGPGTMSMTMYDLAKDLGLRPSLTGIDSAPVHQAIANYLYSPQKHHVNWTNDNGANFNRQLQNQFQIGTAFDVGHHLDPDGYRLMVNNLLGYSSGEVLITDPTKNHLAKFIVGRITHKDKIHHQAINSYTAAYSRQDLANLFGEIMKNNSQKQLQVDILNTGFMNIIRLRQIVQSPKTVV